MQLHIQLCSDTRLLNIRNCFGCVVLILIEELRVFMLRLLQYNSGHVQFVNYFIYTHLIELVMHDRSELSQNSLVVSEAPSVNLIKNQFI